MCVYVSVLRHIYINTPPSSNNSCTPTNTVLPIRRILITLMTEALERTKSVDTLSVPAHLALEGTALIYVCEVNIKRIRTFQTFL